VHPFANGKPVQNGLGLGRALAQPATVHVLKRVMLLTALLSGAGRILAGDPGVGSTREEIIARYGETRSVLSAGPREILAYPAGRVILEGGLVTKMELPPPPRAPALPLAVPTPTPAAQAAPSPAVVRPAAAPQDVWYTDYAAARAEATASRRRILALFTGSDWCPGCIKFEEEVAHHPDFLATTRASFVLLKLDFPQMHGQPPELKAQNEALRGRYGIRVFPTLMILSADGSTSVKVDTSPRPAEDLTDFFVQAVDDARRGKSQKSGWWPF
jgi:hypothetical protein